MASSQDVEGNYKRGRCHHWLSHSLSPRTSVKQVLKLLGAETVSEALDDIHTKKPAQLRALFQKVYKTVTKSQNKRWLQRRLAEALRLKPSEYFPLSSRSRTFKTTDLSSSHAAGYTSSSESEEEEPSPAVRRQRVSRLRSKAARTTTTEPTTPMGYFQEPAGAGPSSADEEFADSMGLHSSSDQSVTISIGHQDCDRGEMQQEMADSAAAPDAECDAMVPSRPPPPVSPFDSDRVLDWQMQISAPKAPTVGAPGAVSSGSMSATLPAPPVLSYAEHNHYMTHQYHQRCNLARINSAMLRLRAVQEERLSHLQSQMDNIDAEFAYHFSEADSKGPMSIPALMNDAEPAAAASAPVLSVDQSLVVSGKNSPGQSIMPAEEEPFLALDPILIDMDMRLLPDGRMW